MKPAIVFLLVAVNVLSVTSRLVEQWASGIDSFSSQFGEVSYSANQIIGEPNVYPNYGDNPLAYSPSKVNAKDYVVVKFATPVNASEVDVYETYCPGTVVVGLWLCDCETGAKVNVWQTTVQTDGEGKSQIYKIPIPSQNFFINKVQIDLDHGSNDCWSQIDAVKLKGSVIDPCDADPCANDGQCTAVSETSFDCKCVPGWKGKDCTTDDNYCIKNPGVCKNGGTCVKFGDTFTCKCAPGFAGRHCELDQAECEAMPDPIRINCGWGGVTADQCNFRSCCYDAKAQLRAAPTCYYSNEQCPLIPVEYRVDCSKNVPAVVTDRICKGWGCCFDPTAPPSGLRCFREAYDASCVGVPAERRVPRKNPAGIASECEGKGACWDTSNVRNNQTLWCFDVLND